MALTGFNATKVREQFAYEYDQKGSTSIYGGAIVVAAADGYAKPGLTATGLVVLGVSTADSVNAGADGAKKVLCIGSHAAQDGKMRLFRFKNATSSDACTVADIGRDVYVLDDQTFTTTSSGRSVGGKLREIEADAAGTATGWLWIELPV